MNVLATEHEVLERLLLELEADGYEVFLRPRPPIAPEFLDKFTPDAIALRADKSLVVEVLRESRSAASKIENLRHLLKDRDNWELRVIWISPNSTLQTPEVQTTDTIRARIAELRSLIETDHLAAAFLIGWAILEAIGRGLSSEKFRHPQTAGRLVETLASDGYLTPSEAEHVRRFAEKRNQLVHGGLSIPLAKDEVSAFADLLETLAALLDSQS
ncbi:MAG: hypothetical protein AB7O49_21065 [Sphingomonadales bacterium]